MLVYGANRSHMVNYGTQLQTIIKIYISCKLHDRLIVSVAWRTLQERWRTTVLFQAKFHVSASEISLIIANFL